MNSQMRMTFKLALFSVLLVMLSVAGFSVEKASAASKKTVKAGETWVVKKTTHLKRLVIGEDAAISAADGQDLTLTVDGAGTAIAPGTYEGDIVLTPTDEYLLEYGQYDPYHIRAAVIVNDGEYVKSQSVAAADGDASVDDEVATNLSIVSREEKFNGIVVTGDSSYTINNAKIDMTGNGGNDFAGYGAAIMSSGNAMLTVNNARIKTKGAVRTALFIGGKSTMYVNDTNIEVFSGTLPEGYTFSITPGEMMEVPYGLGLSGNVRATNLIDEATVHYTNCHVKSHGWGVLSSDGNGPTRMFVKDCLIETEGSGYGAYANGDAHDYFSGSTLNVVDVGVIVGGNGWVTLTDGTVVNSGKLGVMMHQGTGGSLLTINKESTINSKNTAVQIKGRGADVIIDNAILNPGNGILIQTMENDDPVMAAMAADGGGMPGGAPGGGAPAGGPPQQGGMPEGMGGGAPSGAPQGGGAPAGGPPGGGASGGGPSAGGAFINEMPGSESGGYSSDVHAVIRHATLKGDVVHAMAEKGNMTVALQDATLTGAISTGTTSPASGKAPTRETFTTVGEVTNTFEPSTGEYGMKVSLDWASKWVVDKTSYLDGLVIADGAAVTAPEGADLTMTVNGVKTPVGPGSYIGKIKLQVAR